jgi:hypothetical protein
MIRKALWLVGVVLVLGVLFLAGVFAVSESGEVVVLTTHDAAGAPHQTRIWIADDAGAQWLRSGVRGNGWFQRLTARPEVEVMRGGVTRRYRAVPVETSEARDRVHALMRAKYGFADRYVSLLRSASGSIAVRLDPL